MNNNNNISTNSTSTNGISTSASIYCGIKLVYVGLSKRYSFPFTSAATATAVAADIAVVRA